MLIFRGLKRFNTLHVRTLLLHVMLLLLHCIKLLSFVLCSISLSLFLSIIADSTLIFCTSSTGGSLVIYYQHVILKYKNHSYSMLNEIQVGLFHFFKKLWLWNRFCTCWKFRFYLWKIKMKISISSLICVASSGFIQFYHLLSLFTDSNQTPTMKVIILLAVVAVALGARLEKAAERVPGSYIVRLKVRMH